MALPAKIVPLVGLLGKEESVYGTPVALVAGSDGIKLQFTDKNVATLAEFNYAFDGGMGPAIQSGAPRRRVAPAGRSYRGSLPFREKGFGAAYSSSNTPAHHRLVKACGYTATGSFTPGSEKYDYDPTAEGLTFTSLTMEGYARGKKYPMTAVIGSLSIEAQNQAPPVWTMEYRAIANGLPTDVALPAITYPNESLVEPLASAITVNMGNYLTAIVNSFSFKQNRGIDFERVPLSGSSAHLGYLPQGRAAVLSVTIEETALQTTPFHNASGIDHHNLREAATSLSLVLQVGSTQYNRYKITGSGQLINYQEQNNGPVATVTLEWGLHASADTANDDHKITFD